MSHYKQKYYPLTSYRLKDRNLWKNFIIKYQKNFTNHKINIDDYLD